MRVSVKLNETSMTCVKILEIRKRDNENAIADFQVTVREDIGEYIKKLITADQFLKSKAVLAAKEHMKEYVFDLVGMGKNELWVFLKAFETCRYLIREDSDNLWDEWERK